MPNPLLKISEINDAVPDCEKYNKIDAIDTLDDAKEG